MPGISRISATVVSAILGVVWTLWVCSLPKPDLDGTYYDYVFYGLINGVFFLLMAVVLLIPIHSNFFPRLAMFSIAAGWVSSISGIWFAEVIWYIFPGCLGIFSGFCLRHILSGNADLKWLTAGSGALGVAVGSLTAAFNLALLISGIIISTLLAVLVLLTFLQRKFLFIPEETESRESGHWSTVRFWFALIITTILIWVECTFTVWHLMLPAYVNQSDIFIVLPVLFLILAGFRSFGIIFYKRFSHLLWLYAFAFIITVSLGMFYTLQVYLFILLFGFGLAYFIPLVIQIFSQSDNIRMIFGLALLFTAIIMPVTGHNMDYYTEFARSIKIPEPLVGLSALQATIKDITVGPAIVIIMVGISFIFRKRISIGHPENTH